MMSQQVGLLKPMVEIVILLSLLHAWIKGRQRAVQDFMMKLGLE